MVTLNEFYDLENEKIIKKYEESLLTIEKIEKKSALLLKDNEGNPYLKFINNLSNNIIKFCKLENNLNEEFFVKNSFEELLNENHSLYSQVLKDNYDESYANPEYAVKVFGKEYGLLLSSLYIKYWNYVEYAFSHKLYKMYEYNQLFIKVYDCLINNGAKYEELKELITLIEHENLKRDQIVKFNEEMNPKYRRFENIVMTSDLSDSRYLFKYGRYITNTEIMTAKTLQNCPEGTIENFAKTVAEAYLHGFLSQNKNRKNRDIVRVLYTLGQERIVKSLIENFENLGLETHLSIVLSTPYNPQINYDHRFDNSLYLDENFLNKKVRAYKEAIEESKDFIVRVSGMTGIIQFGEIPFEPKNKDLVCKLSKEQNQLLEKYNIQTRQILDEYMPSDETSMCKVGLPSPDISENYENILMDFFEINMMDSRKHEKIQQKLIDALDKGEFAHVKGRNGNLTDIKVQFNKLHNPEKETNFLNGGADINIPVGEVFTTPVLKGTTGMLHVGEIYLRGYKYIDLKLKFEDGYIIEYSCNNFSSEEENKQYIKSTLLFPHETLPMGEFAIGTNTKAFAISKKHDIIPLLPILVVEKMGPHFAIGDPCYAWGEESPIYNLLDKKEIVAKENERTALRKTDIEKAYTNTHIDITLPYDSIGFIQVIEKNGNKIEIMREGQFVLEGTEELNEPLKSL